MKSNSGLKMVMLLLAIFAFGCSSLRVQEKVTMEDWSEQRQLHMSIPLYAKYMEGYKICLDPGHGGDAHLKGYKAGPATGIREAQVNWTVAMFLKEMLEQVGAEVIVTRKGDESVGLRERVEFANANEADIFISLHHNAAGNTDVNYTTVWYHAEPDFAPANLDLARSIQRGVEESLRLPQVHPRGLMSDYIIYKNSGFGVLRGLNCIACLSESSFHSNPEEEERLANTWYNQKEAYGYFMGIARYIAGGIPSYEMVQPSVGARVQSKRPELVFALNDGLSDRGGWGSNRNWIIERSVQIFIDGEPIATTYDAGSKQARGKVPEKLSNGEHEASVLFENVYKHSSPRKKKTFVVAPPIAKIEMSASPEALQPDENAWATVKIKAFDADGEPVADGTKVDFAINNGRLFRAQKETIDGEAFNYISCPAGGYCRVVAESGSARSELSLSLDREKKPAVFGQVFGISTREPVLHGKVTDGVHTADITPDGRFAMNQIGSEVGVAVAMADGFYGVIAAAQAEIGGPVWVDLDLFSVASGVLNGQYFVIDPRYGGDQEGEIACGVREVEKNLETANWLRDLLKSAGAKVRVIDNTLPVKERVHSANRWPSARYIRIEHEKMPDGKPALKVLRYPKSQLVTAFAMPLQKHAKEYLGLAKGPIVDCDEPEFMDTKGPACSLVFQTLDAPEMNTTKEAYAVYKGILENFLASADDNQILTVTVLDPEGRAVKDAVVTIGLVDKVRTDGSGMARFYGLPEIETFASAYNRQSAPTVKRISTSAHKFQLKLRK